MKQTCPTCFTFSIDAQKSGFCCVNSPSAHIWLVTEPKLHSASSELGSGGNSLMLCLCDPRGSKMPSLSSVSWYWFDLFALVTFLFMLSTQTQEKETVHMQSHLHGHLIFFIQLKNLQQEPDIAEKLSIVLSNAIFWVNLCLHPFHSRLH